MDRTDLFQQFCKEVVLWSTLNHPNVLKLVGVQEGMEAGKFAAVSEWMRHGNIIEYIRKYPVNRLDLVSNRRPHLTFPTDTNNSCTTQLRASSIFTALVYHMGILKESVSFISQ